VAPCPALQLSFHSVLDIAHDKLSHESVYLP
jgi:hypothetical protein